MILCTYRDRLSRRSQHTNILKSMPAKTTTARPEYSEYQPRCKGTFYTTTRASLRQPDSILTFPRTPGHKCRAPVANSMRSARYALRPVPRILPGIYLMTMMGQTATLNQCQGIATGATKVTDPEFVAGFAYLQQMVNNNWFQPGAVGDTLAPDAQNAFTSGKSGFFTGIIGDYYDWLLLSKAIAGGAGDLGVTLFPTIAANKPLSGESPGPLAGTLDAGGGTAVSVAKWSSNQAADLTFAEYLASPTVQQNWT